MGWNKTHYYCPDHHCKCYPVYARRSQFTRLHVDSSRWIGGAPLYLCEKGHLLTEDQDNLGPMGIHIGPTV